MKKLYKIKDDDIIMYKQFKIAKDNNVTISELLDAIHVFHEVIALEYPKFIQGHPHIVLHSDGSGHVVNLRDQIHKQNNDGIMFEFHTLKELVQKAKQLEKKYKIKWLNLKGELI